MASYQMYSQVICGCGLVLENMKAKILQQLVQFLAMVKHIFGMLLIQIVC